MKRRDDSQMLCATWKLLYGNNQQLAGAVVHMTLIELGLPTNA